MVDCFLIGCWWWSRSSKNRSPILIAFDGAPKFHFFHHFCADNFIYYTISRQQQQPNVLVNLFPSRKSNVFVCTVATFSSYTHTHNSNHIPYFTVLYFDSARNIHFPSEWSDSILFFIQLYSSLPCAMDVYSGWMHTSYASPTEEKIIPYDLISVLSLQWRSDWVEMQTIHI